MSHAGLVLLTGGQGSRLGAPKHGQAHPDGGTWGGHLVRVFEVLFPGCPIRLLGEPLADYPRLVPVPDPREGPAVALAHWAAATTTGGPPAHGGLQGVPRWWVAACDQVRWTVPALAAWHAQALEADPAGARWVLARHQDRLQYLGGWLGRSCLPAVAASRVTSLRALAEGLPLTTLEDSGPAWEDVDTPDDLRAWTAGRSQPFRGGPKP